MRERFSLPFGADYDDTGEVDGDRLISEMIGEAMKRELFMVIGVLAGAAAVVAQDVPTPPAVKMGLWQNTVTNTMSGIQIPPEVAERMKAMGRPVPGSAPRTTTTQSCLTPDKWQKSISDMQQGKNCQFTNVKQSASGMSGDMTCTTPEGSSKGHLDATFESQEKMNGKMHMEISTARQSQPIVMDATFESVYQGSDCKGISPDSPKIIH
jgi:hypothetical protein